MRARMTDGDRRRLLTTERVERTAKGCLEWTGRRWPWPKDYGGIGKERKAHRESYRLFVGPIPDGLWVLHHCDNPPCVNPEHLFLGTNADNVADKMAKGRDVPPRVRVGSAIHQAKLTEDDVMTMRTLCAAGMTRKWLAAEFAVSLPTVHRVVKGQGWKHVP